MAQQSNDTEKTRETKRFGEAFEQFGEHMSAWGEEFGCRMETWGKEFGRRMEAWGEEFGPRMETWAEGLAERMERMGERVGKWFEEQFEPAGRAEAKAETEDLREERLTILRMVREGQLSAAEAEKLLRALGGE